MPRINKQFTLDVSPERFLDACSADELIEVEILLSSPRYQNAMNLHRNQTSLKLDH
ncbi:MAG: hypothetical protein WCD31_14530 [Gillisia sp.]